jgi:proteic killer suppression protein
MRFIFKKKRIEDFYFEEKGKERYSEAVVEAFFRVMSIIAAALDERDLYAYKGLQFEKLEGERGRKGERSLRLNGQWRLIISIEHDENGKLILIINIEDYH